MSESAINLTVEQRNEIFEKIAQIYKEHDYPSWLKNPTRYFECVNVLNAGMQQKQMVLKFEGKTTQDNAEVAAKIKSAITDVLKDIKEKEIQIGAGYQVGSKYGTIKNAAKVFEEGMTEVKHEDGQVLLLDFWATWCPPCQKPMAHNQTMLENRGSDWGDKVRLIGLSIDQSVDTLKSHVEKMGCVKVEHYHVSNGKCTAAEDYGAEGVPHVLLVDTNGTIVFIGHPASRKLEADIDQLLKGEKIVGEGTTCAEAEPTASASNESGDQSGVGEAITKFVADTEKFAAEMKETAAGLQRAFLVLTDEVTIDMKTMKESHDCTVHTVISGPNKENIEKLAEECKKHSQGPWKNKDQVA